MAAKRTKKPKAVAPEETAAVTAPQPGLRSDLTALSPSYELRQPEEPGLTRVEINEQRPVFVVRPDDDMWTITDDQSDTLRWCPEGAIVQLHPPANFDPERLKEIIRAFESANVRLKVEPIPTSKLLPTNAAGEPLGFDEKPLSIEDAIRAQVQAISEPPEGLESYVLGILVDVRGLRYCDRSPRSAPIGELA